VAPRAYVLGRRAESAAGTRRRIIEAAVEIYRERGVAGSSIALVAERADVSRGTVVNHFRSAEGLLEAVLDDVLASLEMPDERILVEGATDEDRIRQFVDAAVRFNNRSESWWQVFAADMAMPTLQAREQQFWQALERLRNAALGSAASDPVVARTAGALVHFGTLSAFAQMGLGLDDTIRTISTMVIDLVRRWKEAAETERSSASTATGGSEGRKT